MSRDTRAARRAGFTLIELLTVIAILAVLAALVAAGISRVRSAQQAKVTDQTLLKLQKGLEGQWKAICDNCRDDRRAFRQGQGSANFKNLVAFCDNDEDRAEALWMYLNLRRNMPQTFAEARATIGIANVCAIAPSATFTEIQKNATAAAQPGRPEDEPAALLYLILTQGGRGNNFALDDAMQGAQITLTFTTGANAGAANGGGTLQLPAFKDSYGTPITFRRFFENPEMNSPPFVRPGLTIADPLDPVARLKLWSNTTNRRTAVQGVFANPTVASSNVASDFDGLNKLATVISAGPNGQFDLSGNTDDAFGYRVARQGNKGD